VNEWKPLDATCTAPPTLAAMAASILEDTAEASMATDAGSWLKRRKFRLKAMFEALHHISDARPETLIDNRVCPLGMTEELN